MTACASRTRSSLGPAPELTAAALRPSTMRRLAGSDGGEIDMRWSLLLAGLMLSMAGCASSEPASPDSPEGGVAAAEPASAARSTFAAPAPTAGSITGVAVALSTSEWRPGDGGMEALIQGRVAVTRDGCVHMGSGKERVDVVWPADYTASRERDGSVAIYDPHGVVVAKTGHVFEAGGGYQHADDKLMVCRAGLGREAAFVTSELLPMDDAGSTADFTRVPNLSDTAMRGVAELREAGLVGELVYSVACPPLGGCGDRRLWPVTSSEPPGDAVLPVGSMVQVHVDVPTELASADLEVFDLLSVVAAETSQATVSQIDFAPVVALGYSGLIAKRVPQAELADAHAWNLEGSYGGISGPLSALELLGDMDGHFTVAVGPHPRCVGSVVQPPAELVDYRHVAVTPNEPESCLSWASVDVFRDAQGQVVAVLLDVFDP